jgi:hypothetical protein
MQEPVVVVRVHPGLSPALLVILLLAGISIGFLVGRETLIERRAPADAGIAQPTPGPTSTPRLERPGPGTLSDRASCAAIEGTAYRSDNERLWYLANCVEPADVP